MTGFKSFSEWLSSFWLAFNLFILRAVLFFTQTIEKRTLPTRIAQGTRSVLVVGDELAEGLGDGLGRTGLARTLESKLRDARLNDRLRLTWLVRTAGRTRTNTQLWLPEGRLFEQVFSYLEAGSSGPQVVVLLFSARDNLQEGARAPPVRHILRIAEALANKGVHVVIPDFINFHPRESSEFTEVDSANNALRRALVQLKNRLRENDSSNKNNQYGTIVFNSDISKVTAMGEYVMTRFRELCVFNSFGYKLLATELLDDVVETARKVEWVYWKERLGN